MILVKLVLVSIGNKHIFSFLIAKVMSAEPPKQNKKITKRLQTSDKMNSIGRSVSYAVSFCFVSLNSFTRKILCYASNTSTRSRSSCIS